MGKSKAKGTARETAHKNKAAERGLPARRSENNLPGRDVDIESGVLVAVEVKDRQNLNAHKTLKKTQENFPELMPALLWHRTSRKTGNTRLSPDGPSLLHFTEDDGLDLLSVFREARRLIEATQERDLGLVEEMRNHLADAVSRITCRYQTAGKE